MPRTPQRDLLKQQARRQRADLAQMAPYFEVPGCPKLSVRFLPLGSLSRPAHDTVNALVGALKANDTWYDQVLIQAGLNFQMWFIRDVSGVKKVVRSEFALRRRPAPEEIPAMLERIRAQLEQIVKEAGG